MLEFIDEAKEALYDVIATGELSFKYKVEVCKRGYNLIVYVDI